MCWHWVVFDNLQSGQSRSISLMFGAVFEVCWPLIANSISHKHHGLLRGQEHIIVNTFRAARCGPWMLSDSTYWAGYVDSMLPSGGHLAVERRSGSGQPT